MYPDSPDVAAVDVADEAPVKVFASREDFLDAAGKFKEIEHYAEGIGHLILSEISGDARARILGDLASSLQNSGKLDTAWYQRQLILHGVVDPSSPKGARVPFFREGDLDRVMKVGGAVIQDIAGAIEKLSLMGQYQARAEENSGSTLNGASTSESPNP